MSFDENTPDNILGQEFLTWLWYRSDGKGEAFTDEDGTSFSVTLEKRITVQGGQGDERETTAVSGLFSPLREAKVGLSTGKKVTRALLVLTKEEVDFSVNVSAENFALSSFKTPKVQNPEEGDDPDATFLDKIYLMEIGTRLFDRLYRAFLDIRLHEEAWAKEVREIHEWAAKSE